jgi:hypothetical protein
MNTDSQSDQRVGLSQSETPLATQLALIGWHTCLGKRQGLGVSLDALIFAHDKNGPVSQAETPGTSAVDVVPVLLGPLSTKQRPGHVRAVFTCQGDLQDPPLWGPFCFMIGHELQTCLDIELVPLSPCGMSSLV